VNSILDEAGINSQPTVWYMTRAYLTRHGAGPLPDEGLPPGIQVRDLTNLPNNWQGSLRFAPISQTTNEYIHRDVVSSSRPVNHNLVITCCDQLPSVDMVNDVTNLFQQQHHDGVYQSFNAAGTYIKKA
jgi:adenylosuccinate synthase